MFTTREQWLLAAIDALKPKFDSAGLKVPKKIKISAGFPGQGSRIKRVGECWPPATEKDFAHIFVSPLIAEETGKCGVLAILLHELIHACLPKGTGHRSPFFKHAKEFGLEGKASATTAGEELCEHFKTVVKELGPYPHRSISLGGKSAKKQTTRMIKLQCPQCDYIVRTTRSQIDEKGPPICPVHNVPFSEDSHETDSGSDDD
jgi:hypothetical protein